MKNLLKGVTKILNFYTFKYELNLSQKPVYGFRISRYVFLLAYEIIQQGVDKNILINIMLIDIKFSLKVSKKLR